MVLDIITAALIVIPMGIGMAKGFLYILVRLMGWIGSLAAAFLAAPVLRDLTRDTFLGKKVFGALEEQFSQTTDAAAQATEGLPQILSHTINTTIQNTTELMIQALGNLILMIICFLAIVILTRVLLICAIRPVSKWISESGVSFLNKFAGLLVGAAEGLLLAFLFLAALIPAMHMASPETAASIAEALKVSHLAGSLYDGNFLLVLTGSLTG